jgi:putative GTP pyrophosphokinase
MTNDSTAASPKGSQQTSTSVELKRQFDTQLPLWRQLEREALFILEHRLAQAMVKYHTLTSRIKTLDSFVAKKDRKSLTEPFDQIKDVVGLRVVCLFLSDIQKIGTIIRDHFDVMEEDDKIEGQHVSSFGYMSFHFTARMKSSYAGPRYDAILGLPLEIQIRTIAMDAWAATSHYLDYKNDSDVPSDLRRDFYALSGLFYVADRHFEMFFRSRQTVRQEIQRTLDSPEPLFEQELNLDSLAAYLKSRFPDRSHLDANDVSELLRELKDFGYRTILDVDKLIQARWDWFVAREVTNPPSDDQDPSRKIRFADGEAVRVMLR